MLASLFFGHSNLIKIRINIEGSTANDDGFAQTPLAHLINAQIVFFGHNLPQPFDHRFGPLIVQFAFEDGTLHAHRPVFQFLG